MVGATRENINMMMSETEFVYMNCVKCATCKYFNHNRQNGEKYRCTRYSQWVFPNKICESHEFKD